MSLRVATEVLRRFVENRQAMEYFRVFCSNGPRVRLPIGGQTASRITHQQLGQCMTLAVLAFILDNKDW